MRLTRQNLIILLAFLGLIILCFGPAFVGRHALAQKTCINKDGTQTTSEPDNSYGEGGTKETVRDGNGRIIKVVKRDKQGRPRSSSTYWCGEKKCGSDATWTYDQHGRLVSFVVDYTDTPVSPGGAERRTIKYSGDDDTKGVATDETYDPETRKWKPAGGSQSKLIDSASGPDPIHDYSPDKPESIIGDLPHVMTPIDPLPKPAPSPSPSPSPITLPSPKFKVGVDYKFDFKSSDSLKTETFTLPSGAKISVNFPGDLSVGDRFTGTVRTELAGTDEKLRARSQAELSRAVLLIGGQRTPATAKMFTRTIPSTVTPDEPYVVLMVNGKQVGSATVPIAPNPPAAPQNPQLPECGQTGQNIVIKDNCDGLLAPTDTVTIAGTVVQPLAESPRMRVLENTCNTPGPTQINYTEQGKQTSSAFQNFGVELSAGNLSLRTGQQTTLKVTAKGLNGIKHDATLDIANQSPSIVSLEGGNAQHFVIHPADVAADGTYRVERMLTGIQQGAFEIIATVMCTPLAPTPTPTATPTPAPTAAGPTPSPSSSPSPSPCAPAPSPKKYTVMNLGPLGESKSAHCIATGVNDAGNVIGVCNPDYFGTGGYGSWRAFRTEPGKVIKNKDEMGVKKDDLGLPEGIKIGASYASAINAAGHVVGSWASGASGGPQAFWHAGSKDSKMINLHPAKSIFKTSHAFGVNSHDVVVGAAYKPFDKPYSGFLLTFGGRAVIWPHADPESMTDLNDYMDPSSKKDWKLVAAFGINEAGHIVGRALDLHHGTFHAFLLKGAGAKPIDLGALKEDGSPTFESSAAYAINACGETDPPTDKVVGYTLTTKSVHYGFVWTESSGMKDMGTLPPYSSIPYLMESFATAINKKGEVVGAAGPGSHNSPIFDKIYEFPGSASCVPYELAVWYNGKELKDLNELIPASPGWKLQFANGINDKGQIAGSGYYKCIVEPSGAADLYSHLSHAVLLIPAGLTSTASGPGTESSSTAGCPLSLPAGGYIFDNWNVCGVANGPTKDTTFTIGGPYLISFIATYHWNYGSGALPGHKGISLKSSDGTLYGPWPVITSAGSGGAANVNWECHPGITLPAGTYTVIDPDPATWSQNDGSGNIGFARVAGSTTKK